MRENLKATGVTVMPTRKSISRGRSKSRLR